MFLRVTFLCRQDLVHSKVSLLWLIWLRMRCYVKQDNKQNAGRQNRPDYGYIVSPYLVLFTVKNNRVNTVLFVRYRQMHRCAAAQVPASRRVIPMTFETGTNQRENGDVVV
jgi:hypothetical protein